jgi:hypothetical protein
VIPHLYAALEARSGIAQKVFPGARLNSLRTLDKIGPSRSDGLVTYLLQLQRPTYMQVGYMLVSNTIARRALWTSAQ